MAVAVMMTFTACNSQKKTANSDDEAQPVSQQFEADSAYQFCADQCAFGPRTMNSDAHEQCGQWIAAKFASYGLQVSEQTATLHGYDGKDVTILIGPEGDFSPEEARLAVEHGYIPVHLGASRLRTETAAVLAATAVYLHFE